MKVFGNVKPLLTRKFKIKLRQKVEAFKSGDLAQYKKALQAVKTDYRNKLEGQFLSNDTPDMPLDTDYPYPIRILTFVLLIRPYSVLIRILTKFMETLF